MLRRAKQVAPHRPIRILIVDDHPVVLQALQDWLGREKLFVVVGACNSASEALACLDDLSPEIVLLDANMPQISGLDAVPLLKQRSAALRVVIMSLDEAMVAQARRMSSVDGVVHKEQLMDEFPSLACHLCRRRAS